MFPRARRWILASIVAAVVLPPLSCFGGIWWWLSSKQLGDLQVAGPHFELRIESVEEISVGLDAPHTNHTIRVRTASSGKWTNSYWATTLYRVAPNPGNCSFFGIQGAVVILDELLLTTSDGGKSWNFWSAQSLAEGRPSERWIISDATVAADGSGVASAKQLWPNSLMTADLVTADAGKTWPVRSER